MRHDLSFENEVEEVPDPNLEKDWVERRLTGKSRASCSCGFDTGLIDYQEARNAFMDHEKKLAV